MVEKYGVYALDLLLFMVLMCSGLSGYMPTGYIGCYDRRALKRLYKVLSSTNTGDKCKKLCLGRRYRYAATQGESCMCGNQLRDEFPVAKTCYLECPGNGKEICGGLYGELSFYDIWETTSSTITQTRTTSTVSTPTTSTTTTFTTTETTTITTSTATTSTVSSTTAVMFNLTPSFTSENEEINSDSVTSEVSQSMGEGNKYQIVLYVSVPVTAAIVGFIVVAIIFVCRRTGNTSNNQAVYFTNTTRTRNEVQIARPISLDDDSIHIYDQCTGSDGVMSDNNEYYLTPVHCTSEILQDNASSMNRNTDKDYRNERGDSLSQVNNVLYTNTRIGPCNENTYEELKAEERADRHLYNTVKHN